MTSRARPEAVQVVKERRDAALAGLVARLPFVQFLNVAFERRGDELTAVLPFDPRLIGNPLLPALHGGVIAALLEVSAQIELSWTGLWDMVESGRIAPDDLALPDRWEMPKTIDLRVDFLRSGLPRDAYARARVNRSGRRYANVYVEAWQDNRARAIAQATGHFLMPRSDA